MSSNLTPATNMKSKKKLKTYEGHVGCRDCGKPIVFSDSYGMFCEDKCDRAECIAFGKAVKALFGWPPKRK